MPCTPGDGSGSPHGYHAPNVQLAHDRRGAMSDAVLVTRPTPPRARRSPVSARAGLAPALVRPLERRQAPAPAGARLDTVTGLLNRAGLEQALTGLLDAGDSKRGIGAML